MQKAVCCAGRAVELRQSSYTYNGVGTSTVNGRIDWSANYPIGGGVWPAAVTNCPIGKYSCSNVNVSAGGPHTVVSSSLLPAADGFAHPISALCWVVCVCYPACTAGAPWPLALDYTPLHREQDTCA